MPTVTAFGALMSAWGRMDVAPVQRDLRKVISRIYVEPGQDTQLGARDRPLGESQSRQRSKSVNRGAGSPRSLMGRGLFAGG